MPRIVWSNNHIDDAPTWDALLERVRRTQVRRVGRRAFRRELVHRAFVWDGAFIDPYLPAQMLFQALEAAKLLRILPDNYDHERTD